jgi:hypothetical protein
VRHASWKTDVALPAQIGGGAICSDIGKIPLDPDIELVTGMAVVGKRIVRGKTHEQLSSSSCQVTTEDGDLGSRGDTFALERLPDDFIQI